MSLHFTETFDKYFTTSGSLLCLRVRTERLEFSSASFPPGFCTQDLSTGDACIPGAMVGGILLGVIEIFSKAYISSQVADAIVFAVLIIVLLVKPSGLFGKNIQEKV